MHNEVTPGLEPRPPIPWLRISTYPSKRSQWVPRPRRPLIQDAEGQVEGAVCPLNMDIYCRFKRQKAFNVGRSGEKGRWELRAKKRQMLTSQHEGREDIAADCLCLCSMMCRHKNQAGEYMRAEEPIRQDCSHQGTGLGSLLFSAVRRNGQFYHAETNNNTYGAKLSTIIKRDGPNVDVKKVA